MKKHSLLALMALAALGAPAYAGPENAPRSSKAGRRPPQPRRVAMTPPSDTTAREIAEWNAAVDARKQAKALAKQRRAAKA